MPLSNVSAQIRFVAVETIAVQAFQFLACTQTIEGRSENEALALRHLHKALRHSPSAVLTVPPFWFIFVAFHTFSMSAGAMLAAKLADRLESPLFFSIKLTSAVGVDMLRPLDEEACGTLSYVSILTRKSWAPALCFICFCCWKIYVLLLFL